MWKFQLFIAGQTSRSLIAITNLKQICDEHLKDSYEIEVIDLLLKPHLAALHQIVAIPTLVRETPRPTKKIIGDLSRREQVLSRLDIRL